MEILGESVATASQMASYLLSKNSNPRFSRSISLVDFCTLFLTECAKEGVRGDIAFAQSCKETGHFSFHGDVSYSQNNFAGIGATGGGVAGYKFDSIEEGILAQAQHLKTYATKYSLNCPCVDPRRTNWFVSAKGGSSPDVETLGGTWAVPGYSTAKYKSLEEANNSKDSYGYQIINILNDILSIKESDKMSVKVAIDAGHGSSTAGKRTVDGYREHYINVKTAYYCEKLLNSYGIETIRVAWNDTNPTDDIDISLNNRQKIIKNANCDYSVSCHANASGDGKTWNSASGVDTFYHSNESRRGDSVKLADYVQKRLIQGTEQKNRGTKGQALAMCNCTTMGTKASILVEIGFMTNKHEADLMKTDSFCKEQGEQIALGFLDYLRIDTSSSSDTQKQASTSQNFIVKPKEDLNIRKSPNGTIVLKNGASKGVPYTIVETDGNWGLLKSYKVGRNGWINISERYVNRV